MTGRQLAHSLRLSNPNFVPLARRRYYYKDEESYVPQNYLDLHVDDSLPLSSAVAAADDGEGCEYVCRSVCLQNAKIICHYTLSILYNMWYINRYFSIKINIIFHFIEYLLWWYACSLIVIAECRHRRRWWTMRQEKMMTIAPLHHLVPHLSCPTSSYHPNESSSLNWRPKRNSRQLIKV